MTIDVSPEIICTCGQIVFEADVAYCSDCGDAICKDCYTDCLTCGKMYCINCSQNASQCLKCHTKHNLSKNDEKAYLVIGGVKTPVKNSQFIINKTSSYNARDITLTLQGKTYKFCYRTIVFSKENEVFEYLIHFEEVKKIDIWQPEEEYDDYGMGVWF